MAKIVVLDAGHGGKDSGCLNGKLYEKDIVLKSVKYMESFLKSHGVTVFLTRSTDVFLELIDRAKFSNGKKADLFVSNHVNAGGGTGYESYVYTKASSNSKKAQKAINKRAMDVAKKYGLGAHGNNPEKSDNLSVLRNTTSPAVLLEMCYIDSKDLTLLQNETFIKEMSEAYAKGVLEYLGIEVKEVAPITTKPEPVKLKGHFKVQVGAFKDKSNADDLAKQLKSKGFPSIVTYEE